MIVEDLQKKFGIGLSGGVACGKSTIAKILDNLGYPIVDADQLARRVVEPGTKGLAQVVALFGGQILQEDGTLNRRMLSDIVFNDPQKRKQLENVVHPAIHDLLAIELRKRGLFEFPRTWFYEASLLYENGTARNFREIWVVYCSPATQLIRLKKRDNRDEKTLQAIIKSQMPLRQKTGMAAVTIDTTSPIEELEAKVKAALEHLNHSPDASIRG